jgi:hypothetical protein
MNLDNAEIIYQDVNPSNKPDHRRRFLKALALELTKPLMRTRLDNPRLRTEVVSALKAFGFERRANQPIVDLLSPQAMNATRVRCYRCNNDNKVSKLCQQCHSPVCIVHSRTFCEFCVSKISF